MGRSTENLEEYYRALREKSDREDLVMFINTCFAATQQNEYYSDRFDQSVPIDFIHQYMLVNFRRVYAQVLVVGINHFNQSWIIANLLAAGAPADPIQRRNEGELIWGALKRLPANRAFSLFRRLQQRKINNRRTRAIVRRYMEWRSDWSFDGLKYRKKFRCAASHVHLRLDDELGRMLYQLKSPRPFATELFETFRRAHYSASALYELPFTVAESLAHRHKIPRDEFLRKIEPKMTTAEKLRFQTASAKATGKRLELDLARAPLTRLALYVLSLAEGERRDRRAELEAALRGAAERAYARRPFQLGRVVAILDRSRSAVGSRAKRNRPLAVALGVHYLLQLASKEYTSIWTPAWDESPISVTPGGQTNLADALLDALDTNPDWVVIVSDGYENDPPMAADRIAALYRKRIADRPTQFVHLNPVFDPEHFSPRPLGKTIGTVGVRDAEDAATMISFARYAQGAASLIELESYLESQAMLAVEGNEGGDDD